MDSWKRYTRNTVVTVDSQWQVHAQALKTSSVQDLSLSTAQTAEAELKSGQMKPRQNARIVEQKFLEALNLALNGANTQTNAEK